jgi:hypothetical protein
MSESCTLTQRQGEVLIYITRVVRIHTVCLIKHIYIYIRIYTSPINGAEWQLLLFLTSELLSIKTQFEQILSDYLYLYILINPIRIQLQRSFSSLNRKLVGFY